MSASRKTASSEVLKQYFDAMFAAFGPQAWWPAKTRFEVIVGAILTQNTAWTNVETAIKELKVAGLLRPEAMHRADVALIARCIRSAGYFNVKAKRLKNFTDYLFTSHNGSLNRLFKANGQPLRSTLLGLNGIGPETADSIILYAAGRAEFVVDAYTKRIFSRHGLVKHNAAYDEVKALFTDALPLDAALFNEYHALIVVTAKEYCKSRKPVCDACPLKAHLVEGRPLDL